MSYEGRWRRGTSKLPEEQGECLAERPQAGLAEASGDQEPWVAGTQARTGRACWEKVDRGLAWRALHLAQESGFGKMSLAGSTCPGPTVAPSRRHDDQRPKVTSERAGRQGPRPASGAPATPPSSLGSQGLRRRPRHQLLNSP